MSGYLFALTFGVLTAIWMILLLRSRHLREKYAVIWILIAVLVVVVGIWPSILAWLSRLLGVQTPLNLAFFVAALILLLLSVQASVELSKLESQNRRLAEEVAVLRTDLDELRTVQLGSQSGAGSYGSGQDRQGLQLPDWQLQDTPGQDLHSPDLRGQNLRSQDSLEEA